MPKKNHYFGSLFTEQQSQNPSTQTQKWGSLRCEKKSRQNWEAFLSQHSFSLNSAAEKVQHLWSGRVTGNVPGISMGSAHSRAVLALCSAHPATLLLPLGSWGPAPSFLPVWLLGGIQSWHHCPATFGLGGSGVPHDSGQGHLSPCMALARSKMSIKSIQPITVAWMVLGAVCAVSHAPWAAESRDKDSVQSPAQSSTTYFFNKCVTLPEKLLVFSSQTRLIFL